jgi:hypothetical protein
VPRHAEPVKGDNDELWRKPKQRGKPATLA